MARKSVEFHPDLTIIIPALTWRVEQHVELLQCLEAQIDEPRDRVEVLMLTDNATMSLGEKMNRLVKMARGKFVAAVADDDMVTENYVDKLLEGIQHDPDVVTFDHDYFQGDSLQVKIRERVGFPWGGRTQDGIWKRPASNKCAIRTAIHREFTYPAKSFGEDRFFAKWLNDLPALEEYAIDEVLYTYRYDPQKKDGKRFQREMGRT